MQSTPELWLVKSKDGTCGPCPCAPPPHTVGLQVLLRTAHPLPYCVQALRWGLEMKDTPSCPMKIPP